ncbi:MAG: hypothetical protein ACI8V2_001196 [Candidatus Latescibacterota bacterium]|jgi:hypothetical protein
MEDYSHIKKPEFSYRYEFSTHELNGALDCMNAHGFALIKDVLPDDLVAQARRAVIDGTDPNGELGPGQSRTRHAWVESGAGAWSLMDYGPLMDIHRRLIGTDDLTIHRSAAIIRMQGSAPVTWHTDWCGFGDGPPKNSGDVLNRGLWPSGKWFYLGGSRPTHGGLCVIEDSHVEGWEGPEGFNLTSNRKSFYPKGEEERPYNGFDIPGLVPFFTNPGDMILFAHRTYHGAFPNAEEQIRLSCAIGFRDRNHKIDVPWEIPEVGQQFLKDLPERFQKYTDGYTSINMDWKGE